MIIKCSICGKEFDKPSHRNQHERDAHRQAMTNPTQPSQQVPSGMVQSVFLANAHYFYAKTDGTYAFPNSAEGDLLKQAKREIEELRAALSKGIAHE